eukprot:763101-Amphidinium_carterae.1
MAHHTFCSSDTESKWWEHTVGSTFVCGQSIVLSESLVTKVTLERQLVVNDAVSELVMRINCRAAQLVIGGHKQLYVIGG